MGGAIGSILGAFMSGQAGDEGAEPGDIGTTDAVDYSQYATLPSVSMRGSAAGTDTTFDNQGFTKFPSMRLRG